MTTLSFHVDDSDAAELSSWATQLDVERAELLRRALHAYITRLRSESDVLAWRQSPSTNEERALEAVADWGADEDWSDWIDAAR